MKPPTGAKPSISNVSYFWSKHYQNQKDMETMNSKIIFTGTLLFLFTLCTVHAQNIGINNTGAAPVASAALDVDATNKGLLIPRLTTAQRNNISSPATGLF